MVPSRLITIGALLLGVAGCSLAIPLDDLQSGATSSGGAGGSTSDDTSATSGKSTVTSGPTTNTVGSSTASAGTGGSLPVDELYAAAVEADGPLAYYRFQEMTTAEPANDEIASLGGTYEGTFVLGASSPFATTSDTAVSFGGGDIRIDHTELVVPTGPHSLEAWIKPTTIDMSERAIFSIEWATPTPGQQGYRLYVRRMGSNYILAYRRQKDAGSETITVAYPNDGSFHHVVATYDGSKTQCLFIDAVGTCKTGSPPDLSGGATYAMIGKASLSGELFAGLIDEAAFYSTALAPSQVEAHYLAAQ